MSNAAEAGNATSPCPQALFREAVLALDACADRSRSGDIGGHVQSLRRSVCCMVDAFLAARGRQPRAGADRAALPEGSPILDPASDTTLLEILSLDTGARWTTENGDRPRELESQYRALLPALRSKLAAELPGYEGTRVLLKRLAMHPAAWLIPALAALVALAVGFHQLADPSYKLKLNGQVFWKRSPTEAFTEERSRSFEVRVDGLVHEYGISFEAPVEVATLRLDPVDRADATQVDIRAIRLLKADGDTGASFTFAGNEGWSCRNCRWLDGDQSRLRPLNDDPFVVGPGIEPVETAGIVVQMRAAAKKTVWEWLTRLEKPYEYE